MNSRAFVRALAFDESARAIDFLSDLHLSETLPATFEAWAGHMAATDADAVCLLGDVFEVWVGDDAARQGFEARCVQVLAEATRRRPVYLQHGNRDFLIGADFAAATGVQLLADPATVEAFGRKVLVTHGDELCIDDLPYQVFRKQVRDPAYQRQFLGQSLEARQAIAARMRAASRAGRDEVVTYADVDPALAQDWLRQAGTDVLVHGHTHRPASHVADTWTRHVLSDWDLDHPDPAQHRAEVLRWTATGFERRPPDTPARP